MGDGFLNSLKQQSNRKPPTRNLPIVSVARPMGRSIQPNPDAPRCPGKNGAGTSPFPDATCRMNKRSRTGIPTWKKMCWGCSTGKPPPAPRPAPQPRPVQGQQLNSFGGLASTVSPTPIGRGNPGNRTKWDGTARQFEDPTSPEAIAYNTRRDGRWPTGSRTLPASQSRHDPTITSNSPPRAGQARPQPGAPPTGNRAATSAALATRKIPPLELHCDVTEHCRLS